MLPTEMSSVDEIVKLWDERVPEGDLEAKHLALKALMIGVAINRENDSWCRKNLGVARGEIGVLMALRRAPKESMRPTDLFVSLSLTSAGMTKQINRLVDRGLVQRENHPDHKGGFLIKLTPIGRVVAEASYKGVDTAGPMVRALSGCDPEKRAILGELFDVLLEASQGEASARRPRGSDKEASEE
jgi:DNA-binding MarR family transcriptional regulator